MPFELVLVDRTRDAHKSAAYLENPNGSIPVMVDAIGALRDGRDCLHLVDMHPAAGFAPTRHARARALLQVAGVAHQHRAGDADRLLLPGALGRRRPPPSRRCERMPKRRSAECSTSSTPALSPRRPWLLGDRFTALDPYAPMLCRWTRGFARPARRLPHLGPYLQRILARPAVERVFAKEGLVAPLV